MNVCFVLISLGWGGGENVVHQIISSILKKNINVSLILNSEMKKHFQDLDVNILDIGSMYDSKSLIKMIARPELTVTTDNPKPLIFFNMLLMFIYFYRARLKINRFLNENHVDIIHSHLEYSDILSYIINRKDNKKIKWVTTVHGPWFSLFYGESKISAITDLFYGSFLKRAFKKADRVTFVSKYLSHKAEESFGKSVWKKGTVIQNGIEIEGFKNVGSVQLKKGFNILFPGGPKLKKGGDILINAIKEINNKLKDLNLYIALDVPKEHLIRKLVHEYGLEDKVHFCGFLQSKNYKAILNSVDILAMPSRMEAFGMVYLEAMALGVPIIASDVGGAPEIMQDSRNGLLVPPNPEEVASAILKLQSKSLRKQMSENNLKDIHKFTWDKIIGEYIKIYSLII